MGIGTPSTPPQTAQEWNNGCCDILAVALHRMYGLPLMAEFEWGFERDGEVLGYLSHAWVGLPDGRSFDACGPQPTFSATKGGDPNDSWVKGYRIVEIKDNDPHLLDIREEDDYKESIRVSGAEDWIKVHLAPMLQELGLSSEADLKAKEPSHC